MNWRQMEPIKSAAYHAVDLLAGKVEPQKLEISFEFDEDRVLVEIQATLGIEIPAPEEPTK